MFFPLKHPIRVFLSFYLLLLLLLASLYVLPYIQDTAHVRFNTCLLRFKRFKQDQLLPVVYGYPSPQMLQDVQSGKIALGGCVPCRFSALCPFCHRTARFTSSIDFPVVPLADSLKTLSRSERDDVCNYVSNLIRRASDDLYSERLTAVTVSSTDIWLGTNGSGLHRYNRENGGWATVWSSDKPSREGTVKSVRLKGKRVIVEHGTSSGALFVFTDYTDDRGKTWCHD